MVQSVDLRAEWFSDRIGFSCGKDEEFMTPEFGKLDKETTAFVNEYINSFVKWDLITFFSYNPEAIGTVADIAGRLGRTEKDVREALANLVRKGLLGKRSEGGKTLYYYEPSDELEKKVTSFVKCLEDRTQRLQILAKLLRTRSEQSGD